jgi:hypothetical protein
LYRAITPSLEAQFGYGCSHWKDNLEGNNFDGLDLGELLYNSSELEKKKRLVALI